MSMTTTTAGVKNQGPWWHRFSIRFCTILLFILVYQTIGFLTDDIWRLAGPDYQELEAQSAADPVQVKVDSINAEIGKLQRLSRAKRVNQTELREITTTAQQTWSQLQEFRKLAIAKQKELSPSEQQALDDAQILFLKNQQAGLELQSELAELTRKEASLHDALEDTQTELRQHQSKIQVEYTQLMNRHQFFLGCMQLLVLIPLIIASGYGFYRSRQSRWLPFVQAFGGAVILKVIVLLHSYFPLDMLIYPLVATGLIVVGALLWGLIRLVSQPNRQWLLRQYRDAYQSFLCPICDYPIRRGPLKFLFWNRKSLKRLQIPQQLSGAADEKYTCPCCATSLFEECPSCHHIRHALLPACECCGTLKELGPAN